MPRTRTTSAVPQNTELCKSYIVELNIWSGKWHQILILYIYDPCNWYLIYGFVFHFDIDQFSFSKWYHCYIVMILSDLWLIIFLILSFFTPENFYFFQQINSVFVTSSHHCLSRCHIINWSKNWSIFIQMKYGFLTRKFWIF